MVPLVEQELDPSGAHEFSLGLQWGSCCSSFSIMSSVLWISVFSSFSSFSVDHFVVCPSLICGFWLLLRYIQTFLFPTCFWYSSWTRLSIFARVAWVEFAEIPTIPVQLLLFFFHSVIYVNIEGCADLVFDRCNSIRAPLCSCPETWLVT